jgi:putative chitinase
MKAKAVLAKLAAVQLSGSPPAPEGSGPVLARGSEGDAVVQLQNFLRDLNFAVAVDGDFGPGTEVAVTRFQFEHGLTADGIVGPETWAAVDSAKQAG